MTTNLKMTILSFACCNPNLAPYDQQYIARLKGAASKIGLKAEIEIIYGADAIYSAKKEFLQQLLPEFQKYGTAVAPALFINGILTSYGGIPSVEKLNELLNNYLIAHPG